LTAILSADVAGYSRLMSDDVEATVHTLKSYRKLIESLITEHRGSQYASDDYQKVLKEHGIICSMSRKGNCYDNAVMENFFHLLKTERVHHYRYQTRQQAKTSIFEYIETFYNVKRRHSRLNYLTPCEYEDWKMAA